MRRPRTRPLLLALGVALGACAGSEEPDAPSPATAGAAPVRLELLPPAEQPTDPVPTDPRPRTLWELDPEHLDDAWVMREVPGTTLYEEIDPRVSESGALRLALAAQGESRTPLFEKIREEFSGEELGRALLVAVANVDAASTVRLRGRATAPTREGRAAPFALLEFGARPPTPAAILHDFLDGGALAVHAVPVLDESGEVDVDVTLSDTTRAVVVIAGPLGPDHVGPVHLAELELVDTGTPPVPPTRLVEQVVDKEVRAGVSLATASGAASVAFDLPPADVPRHLRLGVAPLHRPGAARLIARVEPSVETADGAVTPTLLVDETLAAAPNEARERWRDLQAAIPAGVGGRLVVRAERVGDDAATLVLAQPVVVPDRDERAASPDAPNVILISIDTLRQDALSHRGGHPDATPALSALAASAVEFTQCVAPAPYTLPSHVTMLSGQQPTVHGVDAPPRRIVPGRTPLLAPELRERGFLTAAFTGGGYLDRRFGFAAGFDSYAQRDEVLRGRDDHLAWLRRNADQRFFLFLHTYAAHEATRLDEPYLSRFDGECEATELHGPSRFARMLEGADIPRPEERAHLQRCYAGAVRQADDGVAEVLALLDELDLRDDTILVVTSDHGQEIGERGKYAHGHSLYEELVRVPLVFGVPGVEPRAIDAQVGVIDVAPTLRELLGLPDDPRAQGRSLAALIRGDAVRQSRPIVAEVDAEAHRYAMRWDDTKLIHNPRPEGPEYELYDLARDPGERRDLARDAASAARLDEAAGRFGRLMEGWTELAEQLEALYGDEEGEQRLTGEQIEQLEALGYLGG